MRHTALKPLLGIAVVLGTIAGATNAAFASSSQPDFSRPSEEVSSIAENSQPQAQSDFQVAQFSLFPWNNDLRDRQNQTSREVQRCLDKRSRRDRENCLTNLRNTRQNYDRQNYDRRNDRNTLSREEKRCLEKRSYRDRENCLTNLRNTRRYDRQNYDRRFPLSQPQSYPGTYHRF